MTRNNISAPYWKKNIVDSDKNVYIYVRILLVGNNLRLKTRVVYYEVKIIIIFIKCHVVSVDKYKCMH